MLFRNSNKYLSISNPTEIRDILYSDFLEMKILYIQVFLRNERNETVFFTYDDQNKLTLENRKRNPGRYISTCKIPRDFLNDNSFSVVVKGADGQATFFEEAGCSFDVNDSYCQIDNV